MSELSKIEVTYQGTQGGKNTVGVRVIVQLGKLLHLIGAMEGLTDQERALIVANRLFNGHQIKGALLGPTLMEGFDRAGVRDAIFTVRGYQVAGSQIGFTASFTDDGVYENLGELRYGEGELTIAGVGALGEWEQDPGSEEGEGAPEGYAPGQEVFPALRPEDQEEPQTAAEPAAVQPAEPGGAEPPPAA